PEPPRSYQTAAGEGGRSRGNTGASRGDRRNRRGPASGPRTQRLHLQQSRGCLREGELSPEGADGLYQGGRARQRRRREESSGAQKQARAGEEKSPACPVPLIQARSQTLHGP